MSKINDLLESAAGLNADYEPDGSNLNVEYLRGQAELFCDAYGISSDNKALVVLAILGASSLEPVGYRRVIQAFS